MDDLISRKAVLKAINNMVKECDSVYVTSALRNLEVIVADFSSAQPETHEERTETHACDLIDRQAAIDAMKSRKTAEQCKEGEVRNWTVDACVDMIKKMPSAQPKRTKERAETHACDLISRQAAIEAMKSISDSICEQQAIDALCELPSAQPEPCVDTIDALDESIKHFDDMAEECRRNANIEQNDYMDMRDDAAEYRQLSIWLNELKWLRERFQSQPDLSEYSDKLWKAAYERGKAEAQDEIVRCKECKHGSPNGKYGCRVYHYRRYETHDMKPDDFCSRAERRTDGN